jgi:prolyl-tRNA editing enzyme YbaK/EbsC (Cys-tRNA(Pro) deacylase)
MGRDRGHNLYDPSLWALCKIKTTVILQWVTKGIVMSKSLKRVETALESLGTNVQILEMDGETRTASQAADQAGCVLDQIAKSIVFQGAETNTIYLFITAGGSMVDATKAAQAAGEALQRADGKLVRKVTGFAIGGVSPVGHLTAPRMFFDPKLDEFDVVWAAAGTPRHIFAIDPDVLQTITGAMRADFTSVPIE